MTSLTNVTVAVPEQLSAATMLPGFGGGTSEAHDTVTGAGHVIVGAVASLTVII
ncbi:hypothetical protein MASR1M65_11470 [Saprospiraceae bacterium]